MKFILKDFLPKEAEYNKDTDISNESNIYYFSRIFSDYVSGLVGGKKIPSEKEFFMKLKFEVVTKLKQSYRISKKDNINELLDISSRQLSTLFVVKEFDPYVANLLIIDFCIPGINGLNTDKSALQSFCQSKKYASVAVRDVILNRNSQSDYPVYTLIVALNDTIERNAPIFAYQIWDELSKKGDISKLLGTHNIIFGRNKDGSLRTFDMKRLGGSPTHNISVCAASRSGKGLTTLATVAAAAANKQPIFYIDYKPEMAPLFWNYMNKIGQPGRVFAYDGLGEESSRHRREPIAGSDYTKYRHYEFPVSLEGTVYAANTEKIFGGVIYLKAISLLLAFSSYSPVEQNDRGLVLGYDVSKGMLLVIDELEKANNESIVRLLEMLDDKKLLSEKEGTGKEAKLSERAKYLQKLKSVVTSYAGIIANANKAVLGKSGFAVLSLFQTFNFISQRVLEYPGLQGDSTLVGRIEKKEISLTRYNAIPEESIAAFNARQWCFVESPVDKVDTPTLTDHIKPFLVFLNEKEANNYLENDETFKSFPQTYRKQVSDRKGSLYFEGLLKTYGVKLEDSLSMGYDMIQNFLKMAGFTGTVDDYVLSAAEVSLIPLNDLTKTAEANFQKGLTPETVGAGEQTKSINFGNFSSETTGTPDSTDFPFDDDFGENPQVVEEETTENSGKTENEDTNDFDFDFTAPDENTPPRPEPTTETEILNTETEEIEEEIKKQKTKVNSDDTSDNASKYTGQKAEYSEHTVEVDDEFDFSESVPVQGIEKLTDVVTFQLHNWLDKDWRNIKTVEVRSGFLVVNGIKFAIKLPKEQVKNVPVYARAGIEAGHFAYLVDWRFLESCRNLSALKFDSADFVYDTVRPCLGGGRDFKPSKFFKICKNLLTLKIGGEDISAKDLKSGDTLFKRASQREKIQDIIEKKSWAGVKGCFSGLGSLWQSRQHPVLKVLGTPFMLAGAATVGSVGLGSRIFRGLVNFGNAIKDSLSD